MSLGVAFTNTFQGPCAGTTFRWVPPVAANMSGPDFTIGYGPLIIDRGKFRNYYVPKSTSAKPNITVAVGAGASSIGDPYDPIINTTRPLTLSFSVQESKNQNIVIYPQGANELIIFSGLTSISGNLASIQVTYDLSMYVFDPLIPELFKLNDVQLNALISMQATGVNDVDLNNFLTDLNPIPVLITDENKQYPLGLTLTRLRNKDNESDLNYVDKSASDASSGPYFKTTLIKIVDEQKNRNAFPLPSKVFFNCLKGFESSSLVLVMKKIMFFTADRVNFENGFGVGSTQLPCSALGYSMYVNGFFFPEISVSSVANGALEAGAYANALMWPQDSRPGGPDVHVKVFCPDYPTNSPGFAHSLNLHVLVVSFPYFRGFETFLFPGISSPWFIIIVGYIPFVKQYTFIGTSRQSNTTIQTVCPSAVPYKISSDTLTLLQDGKSVQSFDVVSFSRIVKQGHNFYNTYEYNAIGITSMSLFQNIYTNDIGVQAKSDTYSGSPRRTTSYLMAYDILAPFTNKPLFASYQSYISLKPSITLQELFNSEPCLIFNLSFQSGNSSNVFQEGGFFSASIKSSVTDPSGLFNTKLVYRIYAASPNGDFDPRNNTKYTMKIGFDPKTGPHDPVPPYIKFTNFDLTWDFSNVLVSPNIESVMQTIQSEIMIDSIQGGASGISFNFPPPSMNLFCAIYSLSELSDNIDNYNVSNLSSLDFPVINFSINNDFVLSLPIYTTQSFQNGGSVEAIKDYGYVGTYTANNSTYTVYTTYYSGKEFDNSKPYNTIFSSTDGFTNLLQMTDLVPENSNTEFFITYNPSSLSTPSITEVDFVMDFNILPANALLTNMKINEGDWVLEVDLGSTPTKLKYKYEIDYINSTTYSLLYKIINSELSNSNSIKTSIKIPFYLGSTTGKLLFKFFVYNYSSTIGSLNIKSIKLTQNTINFFSYTTNQTTHGVPITFYEDLPTQPTSYVGGCNSFIVYLDSPSGNAAIYDPTVGFQITGVLRSPTWQTEFPANMEVDFRGIINDSLLPRASGIQPYKLYFRTGIGNFVKAIDTKKHKSTNLIVTLTNNNTTSTDYSIKQIVSESYARFLRRVNNVKTVYSGGYLEDLQLQFPVMAGDSELQIQGQATQFQDINTIALNMESPGNYVTQPNFVQNFSPVDNSSYVRTKLQKCLVTAFDYKDDKTFTAGVTANGNLIYVEDSIISQNVTTQFRLLEGNPTASTSTTDITNPTVTTNANYFGLVNTTFPGVLITKTDDVLVFYVYKNQNKSNVSYGITPNTAIYYRIVNASGISEPYLLFDFKKLFQEYVNVNFNFPSINQITVAHSDLCEFNKEYFLSFDCDNKLFFMKLLYDKQNLNYVNLAILYGNLNSSSIKDSNSKSFIDGLNILINNGTVHKMNLSAVDSNDIYITDLDSTQRPGVVDFDGLYLGVQFIKNSNVYEIVFDKSYTIPGEIRQIDR
jgi:hypothetical protein